MRDKLSGLYEHNHVSLGHVTDGATVPTPVNDYQASRWKNQLWEWSLGYIDSAGRLHELT